MKDKPIEFGGISIPYNANLDELEKLIKSSAPYCWAAVIALGYYESPESLQILKRLLSSKDPDFRRASLEAISNHSLGKELENEILDCFKDSKEFVVRQACKTAAILNLKPAHECIFKELSSKSDFTRQIAISAISDLWQTKDIEKLISIFKNDPNDDVRKDAARELFRHSNIHNCRLLFNLWCSDRVPRHRVWACKLASTFKISGIEQNLNKLLIDSDGHVRKAAKNALDE